MLHGQILVYNSIGFSGGMNLRDRYLETGVNTVKPKSVWLDTTGACCNLRNQPFKSFFSLRERSCSF